MLANHFGEDMDILLRTVEKTTPAFEIDRTGLADICIIAQDKEPFEARNYFICADEFILMQVSNVQEAVTALIQLAFVLDLDYPKMYLTFEFLERYVYGMGLAETRVKSKKGKQLLVLTPAVRNLINELREFENEMKENNSSE